MGDLDVSTAPVVDQFKQYELSFSPANQGNLYGFAPPDQLQQFQVQQTAQELKIASPTFLAPKADELADVVVKTTPLADASGSPTPSESSGLVDGIRGGAAGLQLLGSALNDAFKLQFVEKMMDIQYQMKNDTLTHDDDMKKIANNGAKERVAGMKEAQVTAFAQMKTASTSSAEVAKKIIIPIDAQNKLNAAENAIDTKAALTPHRYPVGNPIVKAVV